MQQKVNNTAPPVLLGASDGIIILLCLLAIMTAFSTAGGTIITVTLIATFLVGITIFFAAKGEATLENEIYADAKISDTTKTIGFTKSKAFYANLGFSSELQERVIADELREKKIWRDALDTETSEADKARVKNPVQYGFWVSLSYIFGAFITVLPFYLSKDTGFAFRLSAIIGHSVLLIIGFLKARSMGANPLLGGLALALIGAACTAAVYFVSTFIQ
ncbi:VIT1/CCC1 transporter family protein [Terrimonas rubra]|uniref:VIT1/CCC1 transporter family protein n=1 Tax=Terrimonas rubra TaxID=1035890 RepID=A0ABW6ABS7_9BACT